MLHRAANMRVLCTASIARWGWCCLGAMRPTSQGCNGLSPAADPSRGAPCSAVSRASSVHSHSASSCTRTSSCNCCAESIHFPRSSQIAHSALLVTSSFVVASCVALPGGSLPSSEAPVCTGFVPFSCSVGVSCGVCCCKEHEDHARGQACQSFGDRHLMRHGIP